MKEIDREIKYMRRERRNLKGKIYLDYKGLRVMCFSTIIILTIIIVQWFGGNQVGAWFRADCC